MIKKTRKHSKKQSFFGAQKIKTFLANQRFLVSSRGIIALMLLLLMAINVQAFDMQQQAVDCAIDEQYEQNCIKIQPKIDVVFLIDSTGSMADEIRSVKTHIVKLVNEVRQGYPRPDLKVGIVTYRDHGDEYVVKDFSLTSNVDKALRNIVSIRAEAGGDYEEAVADGLHSAVNDMNWRHDAKKLIFLIGDAPPHPDVGIYSNYGYSDDYVYTESLEDAIEEGIVIYTVSGSGMDFRGEKIWKEIASKTKGEYERLSYIRRNVKQYYEEEGIDEQWVEAAKEDIDYDRKTGSILTNTFGKFAQKTMMAEAESIGVRYDGVEPEPGLYYDEPAIVKHTETRLGNFFSSVFEKILFWR